MWSGAAKSFGSTTGVVDGVGVALARAAVGVTAGLVVSGVP
jgi:hypothetical protein